MATHTLSEPVTVNGTRYEALTARKPRTREFRRMARAGVLDKFQAMAAGIGEGGSGAVTDMSFIDDMVPIVADCCGVDEGVIDELAFDDTMALIEKLFPEDEPGPLSAPETSSA